MQWQEFVLNIAVLAWFLFIRPGLTGAHDTQLISHAVNPRRDVGNL